jgi:hypothetical protein
MPLPLRPLRIRSIAALIALGIAIAACTNPAGGSSAPGGAASTAPGAASAAPGAASSSPAAPASAEPTKGGY